MFIEVVFTIAKTWKQPKCPSTDEWIKKMWYTVEYYSAMKKNKILPFATMWVDLERIMLSEIIQTKTNTLCYNLYVESKNKTMCTTKQK